MERKSGSLMELFTCRSCKKRRQDGMTSSRSRLPFKRGDSATSYFSRAPPHADDRNQVMESGKDAQIPRISVSTFELESLSRQSILKSPDNQTKSDESRRHGGSRAGNEKRARFKEAVDVIIHDAHGNAIVKDRVRLKTDKECAVTPPGERVKKQLFSADEEVTGSVARGQSVFSLRSMRMERRKDGRRYLRLVVALGEAFTERTIHVYTAKGGSRILVGAYKPEPLGDGTNYLRQYVDRFHLPHPVDAMSIQGELDRNGELVITAPLFDYDNNAFDNVM